MQEVKISIIVPAYNISQYIGRCLDSIKKQTLSNIEIIVIDDGSTDSTYDIVRTYQEKDKRIKVIKKSNEGVTLARLEGVKIATGKYIGFVDGDDEIEVDMYQRLYSNAIKYNADISHCGYQMVFPSRIDYYYNTGEIREQNTIEGLKDLLEGVKIEPGLCNKIYRKELFDKILNENMMDYTIKINEDLLMNFYLFRESKLSIYEDFCPYHYMVRRGSAANSILNQNQLIDPLKVSKIIKSEIDSEEILEFTIQKKIVAQLINLASYPLNENKNLVLPLKKEAHNELKKIRKSILKGKFSKNIKIRVIWVSIWPNSYRWIHNLYAKVTGLDKKYEIS